MRVGSKSSNARSLACSGKRVPPHHTWWLSGPEPPYNTSPRLCRVDHGLPELVEVQFSAIVDVRDFQDPLHFFFRGLAAESFEARFHLFGVDSTRTVRIDLFEHIFVFQLEVVLFLAPGPSQPMP